MIQAFFQSSPLDEAVGGLAVWPLTWAELHGSTLFALFSPNLWKRWNLLFILTVECKKL